MKALFALAITTCLSIQVAAAAPCSDLRDALQLAYPQAVFDADKLTQTREPTQSAVLKDVACQKMSGRPHLRLLAVPLLEPENKAEGETKGDIEIVVVNLQNKTVVDRRLEKEMAYSDAVRFSGLRWDEQKPSFGKNRFGLRTFQSGSSQVNPFSEQALWLYELRANGIERFLDGLVVKRFNGEYDGDCAYETVEIDRTLKPADKRLKKLIVKERRTTEVAKQAAGRCDRRVTRKDRTATLTLHQGRYQLNGSSKQKYDGFFSVLGTPGR